MVTAYPYATGHDPTYDASKASNDYRRQVAWQDAAFGQEQAKSSYGDALAQLDRQETQGRGQINSSMLGRGVYRSGETTRRQADLGAEVLRSREQSQLSYENAMGQIQNDLQRALLALDLDQEQATQGALGRGVGGSGGVGGGGRGSSLAPQSPYAPNAGTKWWNLAKYGAPPVRPDVARPRRGGSPVGRGVYLS